ncbi:MAG TPA: hypothetical protein DCF89_10365 [Flavobacteriales bacterium]|nr:hypothetical protein [Flavobacteriales bacterium]|tara:strand:+ start:889 stop:1635 length:747 start_codon:yes stop_codon:yes gene_type:complete
MSGTLQVGGVTLGTHNSGTGKVDITNAGATTVTTLNTTSIASGTLGSSVVVPATVGGWKLLNRTAISGDPTYVEFINGTGGVVIDSSTYEMYQFRISGIGCHTDVTNLSLQVGKSSGYLTTGLYKIAENDRNSNGDTSNRAYGNFTHLPLGMLGASNVSDERPYLAIVDFSLKANHFTVFTIKTAFYQDNNHIAHCDGGGSPVSSSYYGDDIDRIKFFWHTNYSTQATGTFKTWRNEGSIALYGLKTS